MIYQQYLRTTLIHGYKFTIEIQENMTNYNLRKNRTNFTFKEVKTSGPGFWNSLPKEIKLSLSVKTLRKQLKDNIHLAKLIPQRFLKPAVCKYPTTVNNFEIYILLPKPCPWMWHLMCGNRVRNGSDRKPKTGKTRSLKLALLKILVL